MKAILFDLDGIITDTAEYHYLAWKALADKLSIQIDRAFNEELKGVSRMDSLDRILAYGGKASDYSALEKEQLAAEKNELYIEMMKQLTQADLLPGILSLLEDLKQKGYLTVLASASKNGPMILKLLKIEAYFDAVANPDSVPNGKPAPDIFLKAAELVNVSPAECVGVEDAEAGVAAIKAANMIAVGVGDAQQLGKADQVLSSTAELTVEKLLQIWQEKQL